MKKLLPFSAAFFIAGFGITAIAQTPAAPPAASSTSKSKMVLPPGTGRELVISRCEACHEPNILVTHPHTDDEWGSVIQTMVQRGAKVSDDEADVIQEYLAKNFPKKDAAPVKKN